LARRGDGYDHGMLHITPEAGLAINRLVEGQGATGLRIEARAGEPDFAMSVAAAPDEADVVVTEETTGARVLLDTPTADYVADKTLDVDDTVESTAHFRLAARGSISHT
jgi:Fe-S cluster assembly iron-binding protein IscA